MSFGLFIVTKDQPIYTCAFGSSKGGGDGICRWSSGVQHMSEFVAHAALDMVECLQFTSPALYLKQVDHFYHLLVSAFLLPSGTCFLLVHEQAPQGPRSMEEPIRHFFTDLHHLYVKCAMNPFHTPSSPITSPLFDQRVRQSARKYL